MLPEWTGEDIVRAIADRPRLEFNLEIS